MNVRDTEYSQQDWKRIIKLKSHIFQCETWPQYYNDEDNVVLSQV
jgi:hypothetical protein